LIEDLVIVGNVADNAFVDDISHHMRQIENYSDLISLKSFLNREFCPRFIIDEENWQNIGRKLENKTVLIVSTSSLEYSREELAMRNFLIARAAKDNGSKRVILLEPDLYYSAQDRGPRKKHSFGNTERNPEDFKKFDGQPFSSLMYSQLLQLSGVDEVLTIHNHSESVKNLFRETFGQRFHNLQPSDIYADYLENGDVVNPDNMVLCAPDKGARNFAKEVHGLLKRQDTGILTMDKIRTGEREVEISVEKSSQLDLSDIKGKDVVVVDDMVRTGKTIIECCRVLRDAQPNKIIFLVTHFYSSREGRSNLNDCSIDEIVTSTTIPNILNRDIQGRLRRKMVVLRISRWISNYLVSILDEDSKPLELPLYHEDMSSKNPRWLKKFGRDYHI